MYVCVSVICCFPLSQESEGKHREPLPGLYQAALESRYCKNKAAVPSVISSPPQKPTMMEDLAGHLAVSRLAACCEEKFI